METHVTGQPVPGELRRHALTALLDHPLLTEAEQLRTRHFAHRCENTNSLKRRGVSVQAEILHHEPDAARKSYHHATHDKIRHLCATSFRSHFTRPLHSLSDRAPGTSLPDRQAGTCDCQAAARFEPAESLTFASLLNCPSR